jgi:hypothetical protein
VTVGSIKQRFRGLNPKGEILSHPCLSPTSEPVGLLFRRLPELLSRSIVSHGHHVYHDNARSHLSPIIIGHHASPTQRSHLISINLALIMSPCKIMNPAPRYDYADHSELRYSSAYSESTIAVLVFQIGISLLPT